MDIAIIGGGTTGWWAAKYLEKKLPKTTNITLYEDPDTPAIGVGESTLPQMSTLAHMSSACGSWNRFH